MPILQDAGSRNSGKPIANEEAESFSTSGVTSRMASPGLGQFSREIQCSVKQKNISTWRKCCERATQLSFWSRISPTHQSTPWDTLHPISYPLIKARVHFFLRQMLFFLVVPESRLWLRYRLRLHSRQHWHRGTKRHTIASTS